MNVEQTETETDDVDDVEQVETETEIETDSPTFQQAFDRAKEQHSKAATETTTEHAPGDEASTGDDQESAKKVPATAAAATEDKKPAAKPADTTLISPEEFTALQTKHAKDPVALVKALEGAFTKKTQTLAAERKSVERLQQYEPLLDAYESDPMAVLKLLAEENGVELVTKGGAPAAATTETTAAVDTMLDDFREALGPELEYLADGLAPAITKLVEKLSAKTVEAATKPLEEQQKSLLRKAANDQTDSVMTTFGTAHPDWKDHEPAMMALAAKIEPKGMTEVEFLEHLYSVATRDAWEKNKDTQIAEATKKAVDKINKGAASTETHQAATPPSQVKKAPPENPTFSEAYEAAKRGERWE